MAYSQAIVRFFSLSPTQRHAAVLVNRGELRLYSTGRTDNDKFTLLTYVHDVGATGFLKSDGVSHLQFAPDGNSLFFSYRTSQFSLPMRRVVFFSVPLQRRTLTLFTGLLDINHIAYHRSSTLFAIVVDQQFLTIMDRFLPLSPPLCVHVQNCFDPQVDLKHDALSRPQTTRLPTSATLDLLWFDPSDNDSSARDSSSSSSNAASSILFVACGTRGVMVIDASKYVEMDHQLSFKTSLVTESTLAAFTARGCGALTLTPQRRYLCAMDHAMDVAIYHMPSQKMIEALPSSEWFSQTKPAFMLSAVALKQFSTAQLNQWKNKKWANDDDDDDFDNKSKIT